MEKKYIVYCHKNVKNKKRYIGYTSLTMEDRLHKHNLNALSGIDTKFYRAILKYGLDVFESKILFETSDVNLAKEKESFFIDFYNTYKSGYNMTLGGDGGWVIPFIDEEKRKLWYEQLSQRTKGSNNPNHSGYSDEELINEAIKLYNDNGCFYRRLWMDYAKDNGLPQSFSKNRFNGSFDVFIEKVETKLGKKMLKGYTKTNKHKENLAKAIKGRVWVNNGFVEKQINKNNIPDGFTLGRIKK